MTTRTHSNLQIAVVSAIQRQEPPKDATPDAILNFRRELKSAEVADIGIVYFYDPPSFAESAPVLASMGEDGTTKIGAVVDSIIARVRDKAGKPLWSATHRQGLLDLPPEVILRLWMAIGGPGAGLSAKMVETAEKK
jgi:hypothetical protein